MAADKVTIADCVMFHLIVVTFQNESSATQPAFQQEFANYPKLVAYGDVIKQEFAGFMNSRPQGKI